MVKNDYKVNDIRTILPELKGGRKYILNSINFYSGTTYLLPESFVSVNSLVKLMKKNKNMKIRIEGHANSPGNSSRGTHIELSEQRSHAIFNVLVVKGISRDRLKTIGFGTLYMLFPNAKTEEQQEANRRVVSKSKKNSSFSPIISVSNNGNKTLKEFRDEVTLTISFNSIL